MKYLLYFCKKLRKMRKSNKEKLYRAAFRLFVTKQFDGVSISDIEKECGMTRGTVFYYAKTKLDLFKQVIEYYIIDTQNVDNKVKFDYGCSLKDYIDRYVGSVEKTMEELVKLIDPDSRDNASRAYVSTLLQVCSMFPDIKHRYLINVNNDIARWATIINASVSRNEIKDDIDVLSVARQFVSAFYGLSIIDSMSNGLNVSQLREHMYTLYNLIKKCEILCGLVDFC